MTRQQKKQRLINSYNVFVRLFFAYLAERYGVKTEDKDKWVTMNEAHVLIDSDTGEVKAGLDDKYKGQKLNDLKKNDLTAPKEWGEGFPRYKGNPKKAIAHLLKVKKGYVPDAICRQGVGNISFVYGKGGPTGYGLLHIIERRNGENENGEAFVKNLPQLIKKGRLDFKHEKLGRIYIHSKDKTVVIRLDWNGQGELWLATAYIKKSKPLTQKS